MAQPSGFTLTQIAIVARKAIYVAAIGFVALAIMTYIVRQVQEYNRLHPQKIVEKPNNGFGPLPPVNFPTSKKLPTKINLEIASGFFPETPQVVKVYAFQVRKFPGFDPVKASRDFAFKLGFTENEKKISEEEYVFSDKNSLLRTISINPTNQSFKIKSDLKSDYNLIVQSDLPSPDEAISSAIGFLQANDLKSPVSENQNVTAGTLTTPGLAQITPESRQQVFYYKLAPLGILTRTVLPYEANIIKVVIKNNLLDGEEVYCRDETEGPVVFSFSGGKENEKRIVEMEYNYFPVDVNIFATYPVKTAATAWEDLKSGNGYIADLGDLPEPIIRSMTLGYYDDLRGKNYLQPVWVFDGDTGFRAFVSAAALVSTSSK